MWDRLYRYDTECGIGASSAFSYRAPCSSYCIDPVHPSLREWTKIDIEAAKDAIEALSLEDGHEKERPAEYYQQKRKLGAFSCVVRPV